VGVGIGGGASGNTNDGGIQKLYLPSDSEIGGGRGRATRTGKMRETVVLTRVAAKGLLNERAVGGEYSVLREPSTNDAG
jgi:hypothetical protein